MSDSVYKRWFRTEHWHNLERFCWYLSWLWPWDHTSWMTWLSWPTLIWKPRLKVWQKSQLTSRTMKKCVLHHEMGSLSFVSKLMNWFFLTSIPFNNVNSIVIRFELLGSYFHVRKFQICPLLQTLIWAWKWSKSHQSPPYWENSLWSHD